MQLCIQSTKFILSTKETRKVPTQFSHDLSKDNIKCHFQTAIIISCETTQQLCKCTSHKPRAKPRAFPFRQILMDFSPCVAWEIHWGSWVTYLMLFIACFCTDLCILGLQFFRQKKPNWWKIYRNEWVWSLMSCHTYEMCSLIEYKPLFNKWFAL